MSQSTDTAKVQILLEGEDARLYKQIINKKQFLVSAMKMFSQDDKLRLIFFNDVVTDTPAKEEKTAEANPLGYTKPVSTPPQNTTPPKKGW